MKKYICLLLIYVFLFLPVAGADNFITGLGQTLMESVRSETENLRQYQDMMFRAEREKVYLAAAVNGFQLQVSTYGNLLLSARAGTASLQKARAELRTSMAELQKLIDEITPSLEALDAEKETLVLQKELATKQMAELREMAENDPAAPGLGVMARQLSDILSEKAALMERLGTLYRQRLESVDQVRQSMTVLSDQFDRAIEENKTRDLFQRRSDFMRFESLRRMRTEMVFLADGARDLASAGYWQKALAGLWAGTGLVLVSLTLVLAGAVSLLGRIRKWGVPLLFGTFWERLGRWHCLVRAVLAPTLVHAGLALLILVYSRLDALHLAAPYLAVLAHLLMAALVVRWINLALAHWPPDASLSFTNPVFLRRIVRATGLFAGFHLVLNFILGPEAVMLTFLRLVFCFGVLVWVLPFKKRHALPRPDLGARRLVSAVAGAALLLDMVGYGSLSFHWLLSWGRSVPVLFWWALFLVLLREWDVYYQEKSRSGRTEFLYDEYPVQWLMIRFGQFVWLVSLAVLVLLAWGDRKTVLLKVYTLLSHPLEIGNMDFSIMGILYAGLVLGATYAVTRLWRWIFQAKFLSRSGMEVGLQDSITTITVYVIWLFGVLTALHVFGLNTASLAVAFGALGIGLGFGLQNIFNNFISGIILLFERPIQVGDDVEINNVWAQVKKINVRSTVVQTYDNASLIIPNADFISSRVTNWSFKDKRLRRSVDVGVAYGSDAERVRDTLLEIARNTPKVLKYPKPEVLFRDFGDSALIFRLRIWTDIDNMLIVETNIRFEIDRLFRERGIEISFPQRDIHIRSIPDAFKGKK